MNIRLLLFFLFSHLCWSQSEIKDTFCEQTEAIRKLIQKEHIHPKTLNDSLSIGVFDLFIKALDPDKRFFLNEDIAGFKKDELQIDDYLLNKNCAFISKYAQVLQQRIQESKENIEALQVEDFDYSGKDTLRFSPQGKDEFFATKEFAKGYWSKKIRFNILSKMIEEDSVFENVKKNFEQLEQALKPKVIQNQLCLLDEISHKNVGLDIFVQEAFLDAYARIHDPNTNFFNPTTKEVFESSLATNKDSFGFMTSKNEKGEIVVSYISTGSSAHKNEEFEDGDIIKSMKSDGDYMETYCVSNRDIQLFTKDSRHDTITFEIKKKDGSITFVTLSKAEIKVEENVVRGYVLSNKQTIGYIKIPSFYTNFDTPFGLGLANDIAKELYKLNKENIEGLIIDLRYNGGGSMQEAANLSGMFINRGPLSILKYSNGDRFTMKDAKRGMLFSKPMLILMDGFSASASEYFAGVMQDYNRAIIVGSTSYGKSSAQNILPLGEEALGYCKVTVDQFYRVTGKSAQSKGIIPDILLPNLYDNMDTSEKFQRFALANDTVAVTLKHFPEEEMSFVSISEQSSERIKKNIGFQSIIKVNNIIVHNYLNTYKKYPLTLDDVRNDLNSYYALWKELRKNDKEYQSIIAARNTTSTQEVVSYNDAERDANELLLKEITKDLHIEEAHAILSEYIESNTKN